MTIFSNFRLSKMAKWNMQILMYIFLGKRKFQKYLLLELLE